MNKGRAFQERLSFVELDKVKPKSIFFITMIIIFLFYLKPIFSNWVYSDEYDFFEATPKLGSHMARDGNLISSIIYEHFSAPLINSSGDLWRLRLLSFLCLFLIVNHVSSQILIHNQNRSVQFLLPIGMTLPASMTFISWSLIWQGSLAMLIAYVANVFWLKRSFRFALISVFLLWISVLMSPVAAFSIFGFHAVVFILTRARTVDFLKVTMNLVALYGIAGVASLISLLIFKNFNGSELNGRVGPPKLYDLPEKMYWIISRPIVISMRFFDITSPSQASAILSTVIVSFMLICGLTLQSRAIGENVFFRLLLLFLLIGLSITPIVVTWSNQIEFRYILGSSFAFFLVTMGLVLDLINLKAKTANLVFPLLLLILIISITSMNRNVDVQFISPFESKNTFIYLEILKCQNENRSTKKIAIVQPRTRFSSRNNIGIFSQTTDMASPWVPIPSVKYVLKNYGFIWESIVLQDYVSEEYKDACVIELEKYSQILVGNLENNKH